MRIRWLTTTTYRWLLSVLYLAMAWLIVIALMRNLAHAGLIWLLWGGIAYTVGMAFCAAHYVPYCQFVWHLFVLVGTACHFVAIWQYVV